MDLNIFKGSNPLWSFSYECLSGSIVGQGNFFRLAPKFFLTQVQYSLTSPTILTLMSPFVFCISYPDLGRISTVEPVFPTAFLPNHCNQEMSLDSVARTEFSCIQMGKCDLPPSTPLAAAAPPPPPKQVSQDALIVLVGGGGERD